MQNNQPRYHVWLWQEFKLSYRNSSCCLFRFSKEISRIQYHLKQDKQQLRPSHIISVNYLDSDQAFATHEFQVQSKFSCQTNFIQNSGEFKAENQVLERNYNRATIHHFHCKRLSQSVLFIELLKIENQTHTFYFVFIFKITPYYYI